jgi:DNA-binding NarL/FixJ family response regulator
MKNIRVLIADDDSHTLRFLSDFLSDDFCSVGTVSDGRALIAAAVELQPHVVITDIDMPTMNDLDAIRRLAALMPEITVIALTVHEEPESIATAFAAGASVFFIKNRPPDLPERIRAIIRNLFTAHSKRFVGEALAYGNERAGNGRELVDMGMA